MLVLTPTLLHPAKKSAVRAITLMAEGGFGFMVGSRLRFEEWFENVKFASAS